MTDRKLGQDDLTYPWKPPKMTEPGRVRDSLDDYTYLPDVLPRHEDEALCAYCHRPTFTFETCKCCGGTGETEVTVRV